MRTEWLEKRLFYGRTVLMPVRDSLSSLVREFLESLADDEGEFKRLERLQEESYAKIERFQASHRVEREELYRRGNLH